MQILIEFGTFRLDVENRCLWNAGVRVPLPPKVFDVLCHLAERPGQLVTPDQLLDTLWPGTYVQPEVLRRYILEIRRALGDPAASPRYVETVAKRGYRFLAALAAPDQPSPPAVKNLVGRDRELRLLAEWWERARNGQRQVVFVSGEAGIGKTTLLDEFRQRVPGADSLRGHCFSGFSSMEAYYPILDALGQFAKTRPRLTDTLARLAPTWLAQLPSLVPVEQRAALNQEILGATRSRMIREFCDVAEALAADAPLLLLIEDLHWADISTLDLLSALARRPEPARLMVVCAFRPVEVVLSQGPLKGLKQDLLLHGLCRELPLPRLDEPQVGEYLSARLDPTSRDALSPLIHQRSDGNPLFMVLMVDHLIAANRLSAEGLQQAGIPDSLKQLVESEFEKLSPADQDIASAACVAGYEFTAADIAAMLEWDVDSSEAACDALASAGRLVVPGTGAQYRFRHAIHRESLYQRVRSTHRTRYHLKLAEALARGSAAQERASEIAVHFEQAHAYEAAVTHLLQSAENARHRYALTDAIGQQKHALELAAKVTSARRGKLEADCLLQIGTTQNDTGQIDAAIESFENAARRARELNLSLLELEALENAAVSVSMGNQRNSTEILDRAMDAANRAGPPHTSRISHIRSAMRIISRGWSQGDSDRCHQAWAELAAHHPESIRFLDSSLRGNTLLLEGRFREAIHLVGYSNRDVTVYTVAVKVFAHLEALVHLARYAEALEVAHSIRVLAVRNDLPRWAEMMEALTAGIRVRLGDYGCVHRSCLQIAGPDILPVIRSVALLALGKAEMGLGNPAEALRFFQTQIDVSAANPCYPNVSFCALLGIAQAEAAMGRISQASASLNRLLAGIDGSKLLPLRTEVSAYAAEFSLQTGDLESAGRHLRAAFETDEQCDPPRYGWRLHAIAGALAESTGDSASAAHQWQEAARLSLAIANSLVGADSLRARFLSSLPDGVRTHFPPTSPIRYP